MPTPQKIRLYQLCKVLKKRREDEVGSDDRINFGLTEFASLFPSSHPESALIEEIRGHIIKLDDSEALLPSFKIKNPEILLNFEAQLRAGQSISLCYLNSELDAYIHYLETRDAAIEKDSKYGQLIFDPQDCEFKYEDKRMPVRPGSGQFGAHALNLCLFLFKHPIYDEDEAGEHVKITDDEWMVDYKIGDWVTYKNINKLVFIRGNTDQETALGESGDKYSAIRTTVFNLNERAKNSENLGFEVFQTRGNQHQLRVKLPNS